VLRIISEPTAAALAYGLQQVWELGCGVPGLRAGGWSLGLRVYDSGFRLEGYGFEVWG